MKALPEVCADSPSYPVSMELPCRSGDTVRSRLTGWIGVVTAVDEPPGPTSRRMYRYAFVRWPHGISRHWLGDLAWPT